MISRILFLRLFSRPYPSILNHHSCYFSDLRHHICIVGSGPSAFYTAQHLLRVIIAYSIFQHHSYTHVDILEKLPVPFGLVRYGIAPDHYAAKFKNVINTFTQIAKHDRFNFWGNISVGSSVSLKELRENYSAVVLAYGASEDRKMHILGEDSPGVISAKSFVSWYNGFPSGCLPKYDLDCEVVAIVGMGNVAVDVARILLSPIDRLYKTDIPEPVLEILSKSRVRKVIICGRRGPLHVSFTLKEFRGLVNLREIEDNHIDFRILPIGVIEETLGPCEKRSEIIKNLQRPRRRLTEFLVGLNAPMGNPSSQGYKTCELLFLRSPLRVISNSTVHDSGSFVSGLELGVNKLEGPPSVHQEALPIEGAVEKLDCSLIIRSIGYRSVKIDSELPFDETRGVIACLDSEGRVGYASGSESVSPKGNQMTTVDQSCPGLYCVGWAKRGSVGLIADTALDSKKTAEAILVDLAKLDLKETYRHHPKSGFKGILDILEKKNIRYTTFSDWERVDAEEIRTGLSLGKPREKITSSDKIFKIVFPEKSSGILSNNKK